MTIELEVRAATPRLGAGSRRVFLVAFCMLASAACLRNPVTGRRELVLLSAEQEQQIGQEAAAQIEERAGLLLDPALTPYVQAVGMRLAQHSPREGMRHRFDIVDVASPNAFALPDGHVYISRGLLALLNGEDELAGILSHEIAHVAARHANQRYSRAAPLQTLTGLASAVVGVVSSRAGSMVSDVGGGLNAVFLAPYGRSQEHEADRVGQNIAFAAGWDPEGLTNTLASLARFEAVLRQPEQTSWLDSHPATRERVSLTREHAQRLKPVRRVDPDRRAQFVRRLDGLVVGHDPAHGAFVAGRFLHPLHRIALQFPAGWKTIASRRAASGVSPEGDALGQFRFLGPGQDAMTAARQFAHEFGVTYTSGPTEATVGSAPAARAQLATERLHFEFTFVALRGTVYQLLAVARADRFALHAPVLQQWVSSFRGAEESELSAIPLVRLRVVPVGEANTLAELVAEHPSSAPADIVAVFNGMSSPDARQPPLAVKLLERVPYPLPPP